MIDIVRGEEAGMAFRKFTVAVLAVVSSLLTVNIAISSPGDPAPDLNSLSDADLKILTIRLERTACYGTCPAYTVTIHGDGRVEYSGQRNVKEKAARDGQIEMRSIAELLSQFRRAKFLSISKDYSEEKCTCGQCTDMPTAIIELKVSGITHRVKHYHGCTCAPKSLFGLESAIDEAANSDQWIGDVSKQGPYGFTCFGPK
jgi:hypothetical protein